jgi:hypothetical protein
MNSFHLGAGRKDIRHLTFLVRDLCVSGPYILRLAAPVVTSFSFLRARCAYSFFILLTWVQPASTNGRHHETNRTLMLCSSDRSQGVHQLLNG